MTKMEIRNLEKAPVPFGNKIHIILIFLIQLILSCNPQKTSDGILSKEILYGEWALVDGEHQVNYPNIEFFADSSAILYSQAVIKSASLITPPSRVLNGLPSFPFIVPKPMKSKIVPSCAIPDFLAALKNCS